jgi:hypothetical protein
MTMIRKYSKKLLQNLDNHAEYTDPDKDFCFYFVLQKLERIHS